jgi:polyisoprenyl-teichoic acid--peptidoglycan teichoic acid transferase
MKHIRDEQKGALFLILIAFILVAAGVIIWLSLRTDTVAESLGNDQVVRVLFVMENEKGSVLFTNVLIYYPVSKKAALVNVPGNTGAIYQSLGRVDRIDAVYKEKGISVYKNEIDTMLGMTIPFTIVVKLNDFVKLTDLMGGMHIFISQPVDVRLNSGERWLLPSGAVTLDGDKVSTYLRCRLADETDDDVQDRYQNMMIAFFTALSERKSVIFMRKYFNLYASLLSTNLDRKDLYKLLSLLSEMDTEYIIRQTITGSFRKIDKETLLFPLNNGEFIKQAVSQATNMLVSTGGMMTSRVYVLEIQNGTTEQGLAHNAAILFQNASYDVLSAINADSVDCEETVIIDHIGNKDIAKMVGDFIHCTNIKEEEVKPDVAGNDSAADVDFTIILGKDFDGRYVRPQVKKQNSEPPVSEAGEKQ